MTLDAHKRDMEPQKGALEDQWLHIRITLMRSRIRIRIKVMRIRNPELHHVGAGRGKKKYPGKQGQINKANLK
jgi:hypothetical protein